MCLNGVDFCRRGSVGLSGAVSLISLFGCSRVALSSVCVGSLAVLELYRLVFFIDGFFPPAGLLVATTPTLSGMLLSPLSLLLSRGFWKLWVYHCRILAPIMTFQTLSISFRVFSETTWSWTGSDWDARLHLWKDWIRLGNRSRAGGKLSLT